MPYLRAELLTGADPPAGEADSPEDFALDSNEDIDRRVSDLEVITRALAIGVAGVVVLSVILLWARFRVPVPHE